MGSPPFRLAATVQHGTLCCMPLVEATTSGARRARLAELDPNFHCSVIGTCLSTADLRKLLPRHLPGLDRTRTSELDLHHEAVQLAHDAGAGAKALHKALDERHGAPLQRFARLKTEDALDQAWQEALASGEVPGAYWAVMSHAHGTPALRKKAFGDVHMLSHLVGAANRADIRRLQALERDNVELSERLDRQQLRLQEMAEHRQALADRLARQEAARQHPATPAQDLGAQLATLSAELAAHEQALAHHTGRREAAESQLLAERQAREDVQARLDKALSLLGALQQELHGVESSLAGQFTPSADTGVLRGRRLVYVGGRPSSNQTIRAMVQAAGGELLLHDGGIEDRKGLLAAALPRADLVVFPVDCVDHDSMGTVKRVCERHGVPFHPVRSASVASFAALLATLAAPQNPQAGPDPVSRSCLRHG